MILNTEIADRSEADLHYALYLANMEGAQRLCKDMLDREFPTSFSHATVIMSLFHHGIELFLKFAIAMAGKKAPNHHNIRELLGEYDNSYPDASFRLDLPFVVRYLGYSEEEKEKWIKEEKQDANRTDQMGRYHSDRSGKPWGGVHAFIPESFLAEAGELASKFASLRTRIEQGHGQHAS